MALKKTCSFVNNFGLESDFSDCYIRVDSMSYQKQQPAREINSDEAESGPQCVAFVGFYVDSSAAKKLIEKQLAFTPRLDGDNFIAQAYAHLKTLPEFAGAVDC